MSQVMGCEGCYSRNFFFILHQTHPIYILSFLFDARVIVYIVTVTLYHSFFNLAIFHLETHTYHYPSPWSVAYIFVYIILFHNTVQITIIVVCTCIVTLISVYSELLNFNSL